MEETVHALAKYVCYSLTIATSSPTHRTFYLHDLLLLQTFDIVVFHRRHPSPLLVSKYNLEP